MTNRFLSLIFIFFTVSTAWADDPLAVHFVNVGQGDAIFIQSPGGKTMLIDSGERNGLAEGYLNALGVQTIDTLIITHPHLDHIGGSIDIVKKFDVKSVIMPRVTEVTTITYQRLLEAIQAKGLRITEGKAGLIIDFDKGIRTECLAPNGTGYKDINDYSVVVKMTYGDVSFLFTGDAAARSESEMLQNYKDQLKSTVLKIGHHGSSTSTSSGFLTAVAPDAAVICVGKDNKFGHPTQKTLDKLKGKKTVRTDQDGTVVFVTDGTTLTVHVSSVDTTDTVGADVLSGAMKNIIGQSRSPGRRFSKNTHP